MSLAFAGCLSRAVASLITLLRSRDRQAKGPGFVLSWSLGVREGACLAVNCFSNLMSFESLAAKIEIKVRSTLSFDLIYCLLNRQPNH